MTQFHKLYSEKNPFIIDEPYEELFTESNDSNKNSSTEDSDIVSELSKLLKTIKKETEPVYRIQHQKAGDAEELIVSLLPVLDSFSNLLLLAEKFADQEILQNWMKSMEAIYKRLNIVLVKHGLQTIECLGTPVDFGVHEVVEYRHTPDGISNIIIEEKLKGYKYKGKVIRESRVVVSNAEGEK